jgi:YqaJ-like viral recombinase domain
VASDDRRSKLHASDLAAIAGVSNYKTAMDVWLEKMALAPGVTPPTPWLTWGNRLEPIILRAYEEETGTPIKVNRRRNGTQVSIQHPKHKWLVGTPDAWAKDEPLVVDAKNRSRHSKALWANGEVPEDVLIQMNVYCELKVVPRADVPTLLDGSDFEVFKVLYDPEFTGNVIELGARFWRDYVVPRKPPPAQTPDERLALTRALYPKNRQGFVQATTNADFWAGVYRGAQWKRDEAEADMKSARSYLEEEIADAEGVTSTWGRILFRKARDTEVINWEQVARWVAVKGGITEADFRGFVAEQTTIKPGSRRFTPQFKERDDDGEGDTSISNPTPAADSPGGSTAAAPNVVRTREPL